MLLPIWSGVDMVEGEGREERKRRIKGDEGEGGRRGEEKEGGGGGMRAAIAPNVSRKGAEQANLGETLLTSAD